MVHSYSSIHTYISPVYPNPPKNVSRLGVPPALFLVAFFGFFFFVFVVFFVVFVVFVFFFSPPPPTPPLPSSPVVPRFECPLPSPLLPLLLLLPPPDCCCRCSRPLVSLLPVKREEKRRHYIV